MRECALDEPGELFVRGPAVFKEYLFREEATKEAFDDAGWFKTGDTVVRQKVTAEVLDAAKACRVSAGLPLDETSGLPAPDSEVFRILGRSSVDIIKSGGYKLSALEIESSLLQIPFIQEVAIVGLPDEEWGEVVAAAMITSRESSLEEVRGEAKKMMAVYKCPKRVLFVTELPRNAMGKIQKHLVTSLFT